MIDSVNSAGNASHSNSNIRSENEVISEDAKLNELSDEYLGKWSKLVSTTNWEKGRIICHWREALRGSECAVASYSDESWSNRVGGVTAQHVGRLRRVYERFSDSYASYQGLYWSHFLAALDWEDAELWLEGASRSGWSVSQMRETRIESTGELAECDPSFEESGRTDDEDYVPLEEVQSSIAKDKQRESTQQAGPRYDDPDFGDEVSSEAQIDQQSSNDDYAPWEEMPSESDSSESPFSRLPSLPVDIAEALEQFKLAIIRHRATGWTEVSMDDTLKALDALRAFATQST